MRKHWQIGNLTVLIALAAICPYAMVFGQTPQTPAAAPLQSDSSDSSSEKPVLLDRVIAIINGDVLLESDVLQEMRLAALQPITVQAGQNTKQRAVQRLIARALILRQMREQHQI